MLAFLSVSFRNVLLTADNKAGTKAGICGLSPILKSGYGKKAGTLSTKSGYRPVSQASLNRLTMLTDTQIRNAKTTDKPVKLSDGNGLVIEIRPNGSKLWRYRYRIDGKENLFAVGEYSQPPAGETEAQAQARREGRYFTLAEARAERERCRGLVKQGIHPSHKQRTETLRRSIESACTFKAVAETWIEENEKDWAVNYLRQIKQRFAGDVYPHIGFLPIKAVTPAHVKDVLKRVERRGALSVVTSGCKLIQASD
jgi:hypothetical protein